MKTCKRCGETKEIPSWNNGWQVCRECHNTHKRERYAANPERARQKYDRQRSTPERVTTQRIAIQSWYVRYRDRINAERRAAYAANREMRLAKMRAAYAANPEPSFNRGRLRRARQASAPEIERIYRTAIIKRDGLRCYLCGLSLTKSEVTLDHVVPLSRGGSHTADNIRVACALCNSRKWALTLDEYITRYGPLPTH